LATGLPTFEIERQKLQAGIPITTLAHLAGLTSSASEARRFIQNGGLKLNDVAVADVRAVVSTEELTAEGVLKLSLGKKSHLLIKPV